MTEAFDVAWNLAKMPIVPGSMREIHPQDGDIRRYQALFDDPKSGERLTMRGESHPEEGEMRVWIPDPTLRRRGNGWRKTYAPRSDGWAMNAFTGGEGEKTYAMEAAGTEPEFQRRGYATAVYDMTAGMLAERGLGPLVSGGASREAQALWRSKVGNRLQWTEDDKRRMAHDTKPHDRKRNPAWPVRDDLFSGDGR